MNQLLTSQCYGHMWRPGQTYLLPLHALITHYPLSSWCRN